MPPAQVTPPSPSQVESQPSQVVNRRAPKKRAKVATPEPQPASPEPPATQELSDHDSDGSPDENERESRKPVDDDVLCSVCNTHDDPIKPEKGIYNATDRWGECSNCSEWFHMACSTRFWGHKMRYFEEHKHDVCDPCARRAGVRWNPRYKMFAKYMKP